MAENICRHFLQGSCKYGDRCRFVHPVFDAPNWGNVDEVMAVLYKRLKEEEDVFIKGHWGADQYLALPVDTWSTSPDSNFVIVPYSWEEGTADSEHYHRSRSKDTIYQLAPSANGDFAFPTVMEFKSGSITSYVGPFASGFGGVTGLQWVPWEPSTLQYTEVTSSTDEMEDGTMKKKRTETQRTGPIAINSQAP